MVKSPIATPESVRARKTTGSREQLAAASLRHGTSVLAGEDVVPLLLPLQIALGVNGLRRGSTVLLAGEEGTGATSLALALLARRPRTACGARSSVHLISAWSLRPSSVSTSSTLSS